MFDEFCMLKDENITEKFVKSIDDSIGIQFCDYYLTNWPEQGSTPAHGIHFQPHEVKRGKLHGYGDQINPTTSVNDHCLIRKIVWRYTSGHDNSIKPRIGYLRLECINGEVIEIVQNTVDKSQGVKERIHILEGVFIITTFQMSGAILRLRVCGSYNASDFENAFDYYALWNITRHARKLLRDYQLMQDHAEAKGLNPKMYQAFNHSSGDDDEYYVNP